MLIFEFSGACRCDELCNVSISDITDSGNVAIVTLSETKTKRKRIFAITNDCNGYDILKKYKQLKPPNVKYSRFLIFYKSGKCTVQPIGIQSISKVPQKIAAFLELSDHQMYTGHCLRRTSATFLADSG